MRAAVGSVDASAPVTCSPHLDREAPRAFSRGDVATGDVELLEHLVGEPEDAVERTQARAVLRLALLLRQRPPSTTLGALRPTFARWLSRQIATPHTSSVAGGEKSR